MKTPILISTLLLLCGGLLQALAHANDSDYFSNDLDEAVNKAKNGPDSAEFVGSRWYNRTTSKSFNFPKLMNAEMSTEVVDGALDATASGPGDVAPTRTSPLELTEKEAVISKKEDIDLEQLSNLQTQDVALSAQPDVNISDLAPEVYEVEQIEFNSNNFSGRARDIRSESSSRAYITRE